jgi:hypothetical protein
MESDNRQTEEFVMRFKGEGKRVQGEGVITIIIK